ncbi:MAG: hypothetical protein ACYDBB_15620 [Armatimonadota bacterium]
MRRIMKIIYVLPVCIVLEIGLVLAAYFLGLVPQMEKVKKAQEAWKTEKKNLQAVESSYETNLQAQVTNATRLLDNYYTFRNIQNTMPNILNWKEYYAGNEDAGLIRWYQVMGTGQMITELTRWAKGFRLPSQFDFKFEGTLGYAETFPSAKIVGIDIPAKKDSPNQKFVARGYADLVNKVRMQTGYGYNPLIIKPAGDIITINVLSKDKRNKPNLPLLEMEYTAKAYFFTRGWDPNGKTAATEEVTKARQLLDENQQGKLKPVPPLTEFEQKCPKILWYFEDTEAVP